MRITLTLHEDERNALIAVSKTDRRHPRQQAAILLRESLMLRGLLQEERHTTVPTHTAVPQGVNHDAQ